MVYLTRKIEFSASHLYHNPAFSAEENRRVFGKCNNPHGHGHNYVLEVTVAGEPDVASRLVGLVTCTFSEIEQTCRRPTLA